MANVGYNNPQQDEAYSIAPRLLLAALSLGAGGIHLAMAPIHAPGSTTDAIAFAALGWLQIVLAIGLVLRPTRELLSITLVVNAAVIVGYIISRTVGLPWGESPGEAQPVQGIDLMTTMFEAALVLLAALLLARPNFAVGRSGQSFTLEGVAMASAIPLVVLFATSVAIADPGLAQHGSSHSEGGSLVSSSGGDGHGGAATSSADLVSLASNRCDLGFNPAAYWNETTVAGIDTLTGGQTSLLDHNGAQVQGSAELDKLISTQVTGKGELGDAIMVMALSEVADAVYKDWLKWQGAMSANHNATSSMAPNDQGMGGHIGPQTWHAMTNQAECDKLAAELDLARQTALKYPTVKDAEAAGWRQVTPYVPGIAAHFMNFGLVDDKFNIEEPEMILYDGTDDDSSIVGLSYYIRHEGDVEPTQGFTGNNDQYHRHNGLCVDESGVIGDSTTTVEECEARGGTKANGQAGWMSHAWVVPGCESPWGVFSGVSPLLDSTLTRNSTTDGGSCAGSGVRDRYDLNPGEFENTPTQVGGGVELVVGE